MCPCPQLLEAVDYLHSHWIMSRDLKLPNLLLTGDGRLKICDFGLARYFHPFDDAYTPRVVTLWYRCALWAGSMPSAAWPVSWLHPCFMMIGCQRWTTAVLTLCYSFQREQYRALKCCCCLFKKK